jgi:hypothetical protein
MGGGGTPDHSARGVSGPTSGCPRHGSSIWVSAGGLPAPEGVFQEREGRSRLLRSDPAAAWAAQSAFPTHRVRRPVHRTRHQAASTGPAVILELPRTSPVEVPCHIGTRMME